MDKSEEVDLMDNYGLRQGSTERTRQLYGLNDDDYFSLNKDEHGGAYSEAAHYE